MLPRQPFQILVGEYSGFADKAMGFRMHVFPVVILLKGRSLGITSFCWGKRYENSFRPLQSLDVNSAFLTSPF